MAAGYLIIAIGEHATRDRSHAQRVEIAPGDQLDVDLLETAAGDAAVRAVEDAADRGDVLEDLVATTKISKERVRKELRASVRREPRATGRKRAAEETQLLRVAHRQGAKHQRVDEAEDGGVGADAESQRQDRDDRESRLPRKHPRAVADIADAVGQPGPDPDIAGLVERQRLAAERATRRERRLRGRPAAVFQLTLLQDAMEFHLFGEVVVELPPP